MRVRNMADNKISPRNDDNLNFNNDGTKCSDVDGFTQPLPPSQSPALRSNHISNSSNGLMDNERGPRPEKVKSRWRRSSELESGHKPEHGLTDSKTSSVSSSTRSHSQNSTMSAPKEMEPLPQYEHIEENIYLFERRKSKCKKEMRRMVCNCILTKEERQRGVRGCLDDCLNRMLMIECGSRCLLGDNCANRRFQKKQYAKVEAFKTERKGWGLRAKQQLQPGTFIIEYVGEVLDPRDFKQRVKKYSKENREHYYFMALKSDEIIDATVKGNLTRFINHSCDPNGETQKWTVNGELRVGFFAKKYIEPGEEITFDYQFQRYGKKAQDCYCESANCRGYIGSTEVTSINIDGSQITAKQRSAESEERSLIDEFEDLGLESEIAKLTSTGHLRNRNETLMLARLMVRAEDVQNRMKILEILQGTNEVAYLRLFLDYHGLELLWSWMVDLEDIWLKGKILEVLGILPIPNRTVLKDSKVLDVVERWAKAAESEAQLSKDNSILGITAQLPPIVEPDEIVHLKTEKEDKGQETNKDGGNVDNKGNKKSIELEKEKVAKEENEGVIGISVENIKIKTEKGESKGKDSMEVKTELSSEGEVKENGVDSTKLTKRKNSKLEAKQEENKENVHTEPLPNIVSLTSKLLYSWKDLKEGFRIPRLERQKRHEDEKEADRRTIELEERKAKGLPIIYDPKAKRGIDSRDNSIASILGLKKKRPADDKKTPVNNSGMKVGGNNGPNQFFNSSPAQAGVGASGDVSGPTPPKVNKDAHRMQFQMELMRKQYEEAMKMYNKQMEDYNALVRQQMMQPHLQPSIPQQPQQPPLPPIAHNQSPFKNNVFTSPDGSLIGYGEVGYGSYGSSEYSQGPLPLGPPEYQSSIESHYNQVDSTSVNYYCEDGPSTDSESISKQDWCTDDSKSNVLIECTDRSLHSLGSDENAVISTDYGVEYVPIKDDEKTKDVKKALFDPIYPSPGSYYITPNGDCYYVPSPFDVRGEPLEPRVYYNIPKPIESSVSKSTIYTALPKNWKTACVNGVTYYYNCVTKAVQWNLPEEDMTLSVDENSKECKSKGNVIVSNADSTSTPRDEIVSMVKSESVSQESPVKLNGGVDDGDNGDEIECAGTPIASLPGCGFRIDPRKRKTEQSLGDSENDIISMKKTIFERNEKQERKIKEKFKAEMSEHIKYCLNPYRKPDCRVGRILCNEDFKYVARRLTHFVMVKEIKHCRSIEDLCCSETVKHKAKDYVRKYMAKQGPFYKADDIEVDETAANQIKASLNVPETTPSSVTEDTFNANGPSLG